MVRNVAYTFFGNDDEPLSVMLVMTTDAAFVTELKNSQCTRWADDRTVDNERTKEHNGVANRRGCRESHIHSRDRIAVTLGLHECPCTHMRHQQHCENT